MASSKLTEQPVAETIDDTDLIYVVQNVATTPVTVKLAMSGLWTWIRGLADLVYAKLTGTTEHGEIVGTAEIINATTNQYHTGNITTSVTINLAGLTTGYENVKLSLDIASAGGLLTIIVLGYSLDWPPNQTQTLTDLVDGKVEIIFSWNKTTGFVVPRVQMTKVD